MGSLMKGRKYALDGWPGMYVELTDMGLKVTGKGSDTVEWPLVNAGIPTIERDAPDDDDDKGPAPVAG